MEWLAVVSIVLACVNLGYTIGMDAMRRAMVKDLEAKAAALNVSIESFGKAYADFNNRALEIESRMSTIEFRFSGMNEGKTL